MLIAHETINYSQYGYRILLLDFAVEEIDHAFEEKEFVFFKIFLLFELLIDRGQLPHGDFQVGLVEAVGVLAQVVELGQVDVSVSRLLYLPDIEEQLFHPLGIVIA